MADWILVLTTTDPMQCYDFVEDSEGEPFPVHPLLKWVDVTNHNPQPAHGWHAFYDDDTDTWTFTDPNAEPEPDPE